MNKVMHIGWERDASGKLMPTTAYFLTPHRIKAAKVLKWTDELDETLRTLGPDHTCSQIAARLGLTKNQVVGRCFRKNIRTVGSGRFSAPKKGRNELANPVKRVMGLSTDKATPRVSSEKRKIMARLEAVSLASAADWAPRRVAFLDAGPADCRFPLWKSDAAFRDKFFCGLDALSGKSFCARCYGLVYNAKHTVYMDSRLNLKKLARSS